MYELPHLHIETPTHPDVPTPVTPEPSRQAPQRREVAPKPTAADLLRSINEQHDTNPLAYQLSIMHAPNRIENHVDLQDYSVDSKPIADLKKDIKYMQDTDNVRAGFPDRIERIEQKIFTFTKAKTSPAKGTIVIIGGNLEPIDDRLNVTQMKPKGTTALRDRLAQDGDYNVLMIRNAKYQPFGSSPAELDQTVIERHAELLISDLTSGKGIFAGTEVGPVSLMGYSWGGGLMNKIAGKWDKLGNKAPIGNTVSLDAVRYGQISPETARPAGSVRHSQYYQTKGFPAGAPLDPAQVREGDNGALIDVTKRKDGPSTHSDLNNSAVRPDVYQRIYTDLTGRPWEAAAARP
jgi:hypothetical protein